jgi:hypothetical protein
MVTQFKIVFLSLLFVGTEYSIGKIVLFSQQAAAEYIETGKIPAVISRVE